MDRFYKVDMAKALFQRADYMVAMTDGNLRCVWANDMASERLPTLLRDDGLRDLLRNIDPDELIRWLSLGRPYEATVDYEPFNKMLAQFFPILNAEKKYAGSFVYFRNADYVSFDAATGGDSQIGAEAVIAAFSNEYRMPLTIIFSTLGLLARHTESADSAEMDHYLHLITQNCYRLLRLSNNVAEIARYRSGAGRLEPKNGDICHFFSGLCHAASLLTSAINIPLDAEIPEKCVVLTFDPQKLSTAFLNMISNSCKYTREGNRIKVRLQIMDRQVVVTVSDRGQGIKPDLLPYIFHPYFTYDPEGKPYSGAGLGLTIAKYIIALHAGTVAVQSKEGEGTSVSFTLPIVTDDTLPEYTAENGADYLADRFSTLFIELSDVCRCPMP